MSTNVINIFIHKSPHYIAKLICQRYFKREWCIKIADLYWWWPVLDVGHFSRL
ncbi:MAG: hypothetical protein ACI978_000049 [Oleispira sp.]|jgi:hypothetical protein